MAANRSANDGASPWRVLLVDDSRDDAELAEIALREGGLAVECRWVYTAAGLRQALAEFAPQLVVSDMNIPGFSGAEAQAAVRAHDPALPFVFLTGSLYAPGAELPAADGLLLKDDLSQLPDLARRLLE